jgi:hypothetical protein
MLEPRSTPADTPPGTTAGATFEPAGETYRRLRQAGLSAGEAGSLTAHLTGLAIGHGGWRIEEVERLLFVRELVRTGRIGS